MIFDEVSKAPESRTITPSNIYISSLGGKLNETTDEDNPFAFKAAGYAVIFLSVSHFYDILITRFFTIPASFRVHFQDIFVIIQNPLGYRTNI